MGLMNWGGLQGTRGGPSGALATEATWNDWALAQGSHERLARGLDCWSCGGAEMGDEVAR